MARFFKRLLSNKTEDAQDSFTSAHLGEENNFYYNEELKQWVVRGEEDKVRESLDTAPPPLAPGGAQFAQAPPAGALDPNGQDPQGSEPSSTCSNPLGRRVLTSSQLYTNIPGMNVFEAKPANAAFVNIPTSSSSQFIPSKDDFDASLVNDAYAELMKATAHVPVPAPEPEHEELAPEAPEEAEGLGLGLGADNVRDNI